MAVLKLLPSGQGAVTHERQTFMNNASYKPEPSSE